MHWWAIHVLQAYCAQRRGPGAVFATPWLAGGELHTRKPEMTMLFEGSKPEWYFQTHKNKRQILLLCLKRKHTAEPLNK